MAPPCIRATEPSIELSLIVTRPPCIHKAPPLQSALESTMELPFTRATVPPSFEIKTEPSVTKRAPPAPLATLRVLEFSMTLRSPRYRLPPPMLIAPPDAHELEFAILHVLTATMPPVMRNAPPNPPHVALKTEL
eukprot:7376385-Prymnesium_polylepis.3